MATVEQKVPPLAAGDNLTRQEFLRRWEAHPEIKWAELIGSIVYMPSPLSGEHGDHDNHVSLWLGTYAAYTPGTKASNNATTLMLEDAPQPDVSLRIIPSAGGRTSIVDKLLAGALELIAEICRSSAAYDLHQKLELYQEAGVTEYVAVLLFERQIRWFRLHKGKYQLLQMPTDGIWRSQVFPGLWLNNMAMLSEDMPNVLATLQKGLQSAEHQAFVAQLQKKMSVAKKKS